MTLDEHVMAAEREYLLRTLEECAWNISQTARVAGRSRDGIHRLIAKHGISRPGQPRIYGNAQWIALRA